MWAVNPSGLLKGFPDSLSLDGFGDGLRVYEDAWAFHVMGIGDVRVLCRWVKLRTWRLQDWDVVVCGRGCCGHGCCGHGCCCCCCCCGSWSWKKHWQNVVSQSARSERYGVVPAFDLKIMECHYFLLSRHEIAKLTSVHFRAKLQNQQQYVWADEIKWHVLDWTDGWNARHEWRHLLSKNHLPKQQFWVLNWSLWLEPHQTDGWIGSPVDG